MIFCPLGEIGKRISLKILFFGLTVQVCQGTPLLAHDHNNPDQDAWYKSLTMPDNPTSLCCGEADAYWADEVHFRNGKTYVTITDDRDDKPLKRPHIANGTVIEVPNNKMKWDKGNPTGHGILFMSPEPFKYIYCYVQPGGS